MRRIRCGICILFFVVSVPATHAGTGILQISTIIQQSIYPFFGSNGNGRDYLRLSQIGVMLRSCYGNRVLGVLDIAYLTPFSIETKYFPARSYSKGTLTDSITGADFLFGVGYIFDLSPFDIFISGGLHIGTQFRAGGNYLAVFGLGNDIQTRIRLGKIMTYQISFRWSVDFGGKHNFNPGSSQFSSVAASYGLNTGIGFHLSNARERRKKSKQESSGA